MQEKIKNFYELNKQKIQLFSSVALVMLLIILTISIAVRFIGRNVSYAKLEDILEQGARAYIAEHPEEAPTSTNPTVVIESSKLIEDKKIKELKKYIKDSSCTGHVVVDYNNNSSKYQAYLTCKKYKTEKLIDVLKKNNKISQIGDGLHEMNNEFVYRGENPNNYVKFADEIWRIVKIDKNNNILMIITKPSETENMYYVWDDRYNTEQEENYGINNYTLSRISLSIQKKYNNLYAQYEDLLTKYDLCYGKRTSESTLKDGSLECSDLMKNQTIGLLPVYDFMNASLDSQCEKTKSKQCQNYNYLGNVDYNWWTITASQKNTHRVFYVESGVVEGDVASSTNMARYVIAVNSDVLFDSGSGTSKDPYIFR